MKKVETLIKEVAPFVHPDAPPKLIGKGLNVMLSPLPRNKRAKNPHVNADGSLNTPRPPEDDKESEDDSQEEGSEAPEASEASETPEPVEAAPAESAAPEASAGEEGFKNTPFPEGSGADEAAPPEGNRSAA